MKKLILALSFLALCVSPAFAAYKDAPNVSKATDTLSVANGGTGSTFNIANQKWYPSTVTVSNFSGTSPTITNRKEYKFSTSATRNAAINTTDFLFTDGSPISNRYGFVYSETPYKPTFYGTYSVEFLALTQNLDLYMSAQSYGVVSIEVDGELVFVQPGTSQIGAVKNTAQAGGSTTITLASSASSTDGMYNQSYIYIYGGTGVGQRRKVTGYVGSTKVATVDSAWTTNPDSTSTYAIYTSDKTYFVGTTSSLYYPTLTFSGELRPHYIKITSIDTPLFSVGVDSYGTILKPAQSYAPTAVIVGDSYLNSYGSNAGSSYAYVMAKNLGMKLKNLGVSGSGFVAKGAYTNYADRVAPPKNSWKISTGGASGGTYTLTQGGTTTDNIAYNASPSAVQTALNNAFGTNQWSVTYANGGTSQDVYQWVAQNVGTSTSSSETLIIDYTSLRGYGITPFTSRFTGDIDAVKPTDANGADEKFYILLQGSVNDYSSYATLESAASSLISALSTKYPLATIVMMGTPMTYGPMTLTALTSESALETASAALPKINGMSAFLTTFNSTTGVGYLNGTTTVATAAGASGVNTDISLMQDATHPTPFGHLLLGNFYTEKLSTLMNKTK